MITTGLSLDIICLCCPHDKQDVEGRKDVKVVSPSLKQA